jgi:hypothetical protein
VQLQQCSGLESCPARQNHRNESLPLVGLTSVK